MVTALLSHEVSNFEEWKKGFDADSASRDAAGFNTMNVYTAHDNPNMVTIHLEAPSAEAIQGFISNPALAEAMKAAGVTSAPQISILNKVS